MTDIVTEVVGEAETLVEDAVAVFGSKPGGLIDRWHKEAARRAEAQREREDADERIEQPAYRSVKVAQQSPEVFTSITYTIAPGGNAPVLPLWPYRFRATLLVITPAATVILAKDQGVAIGGVGYTLPYGIPLVLVTRSQVYAVNNTAAPVQVSVIAESYAPEQS